MHQLGTIRLSSYCLDIMGERANHISPLQGRFGFSLGRKVANLPRGVAVVGHETRDRMRLLGAFVFWLGAGGRGGQGKQTVERKPASELPVSSRGIKTQDRVRVAFLFVYLKRHPGKVAHALFIPLHRQFRFLDKNCWASMCSLRRTCDSLDCSIGLCFYQSPMNQI